VVFAYYENLSSSEQRVYRESDKLTTVKLTASKPMKVLVSALEKALETERRSDTEKACRKLAQALADDLKIRRLSLSVLAVRPHDSWGELHGSCQPREGASAAEITLWMRTAQRKRVVAFRTFLRTFLHEFGHHLDYELYKLADSFHTEGFFKRESSLFYQLVPREKKRNS
jgi:hypothetical protein